jgi:hypothetical protein
MGPRRCVDSQDVCYVSISCTVNERLAGLTSTRREQTPTRGHSRVTSGIESSVKGQAYTIVFDIGEVIYVYRKTKKNICKNVKQMRKINKTSITR